MEQDKTPNVLVVEDEPDMALMLKRLLERKFSATVEIAKDHASAREKISSGTFDIITLDYKLPDGDGLGLLREINEIETPPAVIMVTGYGDERTAAKSFKLGASGYVVKDKRLSTLLPDAVEHAISEVRLRRVEEALIFEQEQLLSLFESIDEAIYVVDPESHEILYANKFLKNAFGKDLVGGICYRELQGVDEPCEFCTNEIILKDKGKPYTWEYHNPIVDRDYQITDRIIKWPDDRDVRFELAIDITKRKRTEEALRKSEERLRMAGKAAYDLIYEWDVETGHLEWFGDIDGMLGYEQGKISQSIEAWLNLIHPEDAWQLEAAVGFHKTSTEPIRYGYRVKHMDGSWRYWNDHGLPLLDENGHPYMWVGVCTDITEQKEGEEALRVSEEKYRLLAENITDVIWIMELDGFKRIYTSPSVERSTGFTPEEVAEMSPEELVTPETLKNVLRTLEEELERDTELCKTEPHRTTTFEAEQICKDGSTVWVEVTAKFLRDDKGNPTHVLGVNRDIAERKKAEEEIKRINAELESYARTVSHDLKGPLTGIMLAVEMLVKSLEGIDTGDAEEIDEIVVAINTNARNARGRIEGLLALAGAGQVPRGTSPVDVREVVEGVLAEGFHEIKEKGIEVDVSGDLGTITASPTQMQQVFSNLIGNAIRHNDSENPVMWVSHLGDEEDGAHRYLVRDNGPGIPEDIIDKVFLPFTSGKDGDTGIGLSIVEKLVKVYGGEIRAYNEGGACFEFTLKDYKVE